MAGFVEKNHTLSAGGINLGDIAREHGTPTYIYSADHIRGQFAALKDAMAKALPKNKQPLLCYACKANSNVAVLSLLNGIGSGLEIVSEGELRRGLKAGFDPQKIVSTGVGKQRGEIEACLNAGIRQFNVESLPELEFINVIAGEMKRRAPVVFRLNPDVSGGGHSKISTGRKRDKFGLSADGVFRAYTMAKTMKNVEPLGLSIHIGSQVFDVKAFEKAFAKLPALVAELRKEGFTVARLDIGGGFPIQYNDEKLLDLDAYAAWVRDIILPLETEIVMEPGRYLVGNSGALLTKVLYVKETPDRNFLVLDAAMNDLIRPTLYEAYHGIEPVQNRNAPKKTYDVVGPVCETGDTFATGREIPELHAGDLVVIRSAGAYGFSMASNYNTRPLPAEIMADGDRSAVIRPRQSYDDIINKDIIPDWLK
ncbi:MAG: diaminopimelate decarboxylase [Alphaproteobacteria bacterium]